MVTGVMILQTLKLIIPDFDKGERQFDHNPASIMRSGVKIDLESGI